MLTRESSFWYPNLQYTGNNEYPPQSYDSYDLFYTNISFGYHIHRLLYHAIGPKRHDFWSLFLHHWITIILISVSFLSGTCQTGVLVLFIHDNGDIWIPLSKLFDYNGYKKIHNMFLYIFFFTWIQFRIYWFSKLAIYDGWMYGHGYDNYFLANPGCFTCFLLMILLECLHIYWWIGMIPLFKNLIVYGQRIAPTNQNE